MRRLHILAVLVAALLFTGVAMAEEYQVKKNVNGLDVTVSIDKNPPAMGDNTVMVAVRDEAGKPVTDIKVRVDYEMPAMPGMPAMRYKSDATASGDTFVAPVNFSMAGPWNVAVKILKSGKVSTVKFNVDVR